MNLDWLHDRTIYLTLHGSQCYGLSNELSDVDVKGICVPPIRVENDLFFRFEQAENDKKIEDTYSYYKNPKNPKFDSVIYSLRKFFILSSNVNPNIIEVLYTDEKDHLICKPLMQKLIEKRNLFLSTRAKFTFSGYAWAQLAKIERHRKWILKGELQKPKREDFGLPPIVSFGVNEVFSYIKSKVEEWNLNQFSIDEKDRSELKETIWDLIFEVSNKNVSWDNWPDAYTSAIINKMQRELSLKDEVIDLINREKEYLKAKNTYESWLRWKNERNPARLELEVKYKMDTKHASHLVRLLRMGYEILTQGKVIVKRPDADEIIAIKNGAWSYEKLMEYKDQLQNKIDDAYKTIEEDRKLGKPVILPKNVDFEQLNNLYHELYQLSVN